MVETLQIWQKWAKNLQRWGVKEGAVALLDAAGPLTLLLAQFIYLSQPLLNRFVSPNSLSALAAMLEEPAQTKAFVKFIREAS